MDSASSFMSRHIADSSPGNRGFAIEQPVRFRCARPLRDRRGETSAPFDTMTFMVATRQPISPQAAARYRERWAIARERLDEELRATSMEAKLRQLANLMQSAREMGWSRSLDEEDDAVRARWMALRRARLGKA